MNQNTGLIQRAAQTAVAEGKKRPQSIKEYIQAYEGEIAKALPSVMTPERFSRIALSAVSNTPKLAECTPMSFLAAMMNAAQLGLEPNTPLGQAYLIPFRNNKANTTECQFQIGYKGLIDLAYRSGDVSIVQAHAVYENDEFEYELGLDPKLVHRPASGERGKAIAYYAMFKLTNGGYGFQVFSRSDIEAHAKRYSKSFSSGPWQTNFDEMAKKTVLKAALKYAPLKSDFIRGMTADETIKRDISDDMSLVMGDVIVVEECEVIDEKTGEIINAEGRQ